MTILDDIIDYKRKEVAVAKANTPIRSLEALARDAAPPRGFERALRRAALTGFALIAEIKKASPSKGVIRFDFKPADHARAYAAGGAACLSVLTDRPSFQGSPRHLKTARAAVSLPILRKDFMIDPYQAVEARAWGADCILLIMAILSDDQVREIADAALRLHLDALFEVHNEPEVERALGFGATMIGVNNRDLKTFSTDLSTTEKLARHIPADRLIVSESGIGAYQDLILLQGCGAHAYLVGETLMRDSDIAAATQLLLNGPRSV